MNYQIIQLSLNNVLLNNGGCMRGKRSELKFVDDSFDNWCIEHEEEINEILQPFIKMPSKTREIKNPSIYVSSKKELYD